MDIEWIIPMIEADMLITLARAAAETRAQEQEKQFRVRALLHYRALAAVGRLTSVTAPQARASDAAAPPAVSSPRPV